MTKNELVSAIAKRSGISKADVEHVINNSLNVIRELAPEIAIIEQ